MSFTIPMLAEVDAGADDPALLVLEDGTSLRGEAFGPAAACSGRRCSPPG